MAYIDKISINGSERDIRDAGAVRIDEAQSLSNEQMATAIENIGAANVVDVENLKSALSQEVQWEQGSIISGTGKNASSDTRIRTNYIYVPQGSKIEIAPINRKVYVYKYDVITNRVVSEFSWQSTPFIIDDDESACYIRIVQAFNDSTPITPEDNNCEITIINSTVDDLLSETRINDYGATNSAKWIQAGISANGTIIDNQNRTCLKYPVFIPKMSTIKILIEEEQDAYFYLYDLNHVVYKNSGRYLTQNSEIYVDRDSYFNLTLRKHDQSIFPVSERRSTFVVIPQNVNALKNIPITDSYTFVQGGLTSDGITTIDNSRRIRIENKVPVEETSYIKVKANGQCYYWYLLDEENNIIRQSDNWQRLDNTIFVPVSCWFNVTVGKRDLNTDITPDERTVSFAVISYINSMLNSDCYSYSGEIVPLGKHKFTVKTELILSELPSWIQGCFLHGDYLFVSNGNAVNVYLRNNGNLFSSFSLDAPNSNHSNTINKSTEYPVGNTTYPYIYISEYYGEQRIFVNEIAQNGTTFSATLVQTIAVGQLDTAVVGAGYADFAIDSYGKKLYLIRYKLPDNYQAENGNFTVITVFNLPSPTDGDISLTNEDILQVFTIDELIFARQQSFFENGRIFFTAGAGTTEYFYSIDVENQRIATKIDIANAVDNMEAEASMVEYDKLLVVCAGTRNVKALSFNT